MNKQALDFIAQIAPGAQTAFKQYGVPASVSIAQAILESGWGKSGLSQKAFNLFGIKADSNWHGASVNMPTTEYLHGKKMTVNAPFRKYKSFSESIHDHAEFLKNNHRYEPAFQCTTGVSFASEIANCGYATDPAYAHLLIQLIRQYSLDKYDGIVS
jgi:flagellar rod assembly protein/muramidase FlgJ